MKVVYYVYRKDNEIPFLITINEKELNNFLVDLRTYGAPDDEKPFDEKEWFMRTVTYNCTVEIR